MFVSSKCSKASAIVEVVPASRYFALATLTSSSMNSNRIKDLSGLFSWFSASKFVEMKNWSILAICKFLSGRFALLANKVQSAMLVDGN